MFNTVAQCHQRADTRRVLKYVNQLRHEFGMKPIRYLYKGVIGDEQTCSLAASLSNKYVDASVNDSTIDMTRFSRVNNNRGRIVQERAVSPPKYVTDWVRKFDDSTFPGLVVAEALTF